MTDNSLLEMAKNDALQLKELEEFARKAEQEGKGHAAKLFRAGAASKTARIHGYLRKLKRVKDTNTNCKLLIKEAQKNEKLLIKMTNIASTDNDKISERLFRYSVEVEKTFAIMLSGSLEYTDNQTNKDFFVCKVCGHIATGSLPDKCPVCKVKKQAFTPTL